MGCIRNLLWFTVFAFIITGCGGGDTSIAASDSTGTGSGGTGGGGSGGGGSSSILLKWTAPTTLADGTTAVSLSDISGYKIFYGTSATNTPNMISINDGTATQTTITLPAGSYYFVICAIDQSGVSGLRSAALQKSI